MQNITFLNPKIRLVNAVTEWLTGNVRTTAAGALSLAHILAVVPTRQSGRQLRLALARAFAGQGVVPPRILLPSALAVPADSSLQTASPAEISAALILFLRTADSSAWPSLFPKGLKKGCGTPSVIALAEQLDEIWSALGASGLLMQDVLASEKAREVIEKALGDEVGRWEDLADFESAFFAFLNGKGLRHHSQALAAAKSSPAPLPDGVERIVLPGLVDPTPILFDVLQAHAAVNPSLAVDVLIHADAADTGKFDAWGRPLIDSWTGDNAPVIPLDDADIIIANNETALAERLAADFPAPGNHLELPALGLADTDLFPPIEAAFNARGYGEIHNPERHFIAASSLGRMVANIIQMLTEQPVKYTTLSAFLRENDVLTALQPLRRTRILAELDAFQNDTLPVDMPDSIDNVRKNRENGQDEYAYPELREAYATVRKWLAAGKGDITDTVLRILREIFAHRQVGDQPGDREFLAAADTVREVLAGMSSPLLAELDGPSRVAILRHTLSKASYQLEPETTDALKTEGWLELAWSPADNIAVAGMTEGKVPDSIVGHAFLPDRLRVALELESNARRLARDSFLLAELVASRSASGRVRAYVSTTNADGDMQKPSRLLFLCEPAKLPARVRRLLGEPDAPASTPPRVFPPSWRLACDTVIPPLPKHLSASAIDDYLLCPFTYYLKYVRGMKPYAEIDELAANGYGNLCHEVLCAYGTDSATKDLEAEEDIRKALMDIFDRVALQKYGSTPTANLLLQLQSAKERLSSFAALQAAQRAAGWKILGCEKRIADIKPFPEFDVTIKGFIDRVDYNAETGKYCIIDYKTWDKASKGQEKIYSTKGGEIEFARLLGLPTFTIPGRKPKEARWLAVQMAVYNELLSVSVPEIRGNISEFKYAVLGESPEETKFIGGNDDPFDIAKELPSALETIRRVFELISQGVFWPPGLSNPWEYDFGRLFLTNPATDFADSDWVKFQKDRLEKIKA